ncbi:DUF4040 family protein [Nesterenkonia sp. F]|uniref:DUF4040 family protein n=1 Tax=Nesterenkonia sp. F TaxID=795955 RepID=UPI000255D181|nr:DUF4040 family protein [Nesterenkonia sp. F]
MTLVLLLLIVLVLVPAAASMHRLLGRDTGWAAAAVLLVVGLLTLPWLQSVHHGGAVVETIPWIPTLNVSLALRLDGLGLVFLFLVLFIGALVMAYSARYFSTAAKTGDYYVWMLLFVFSMTGMVVADDLIVLFLFWEFTTLCSFFLINRSGEKAPGPARRSLLLTMGGGLGLLAAALLIITRTGTTRISEALASDVWSTDPGFTAMIAVLIAAAALSKSAQFPFHLWLPDAMVAPAPVSAYLHAAAMVKAGIYLMLRFSPALSDSTTWQVLLISSGLITAVIGALFALQRHDIKEMMAFSTISQLGFLTAVIGVGTEKALAAAVVHVIAHALFKASLFMMVGIVEHESGSRDIRVLHGLHRTMRVSLVITTLGSLSMAGVPPMLGFVSKEGLLGGFHSAEFSSVMTWGITLVAVVAAIGTFAYCGRIVLGSFTSFTGAGPRDEPREPMAPEASHEAAWTFWLPAMLPAAAGLLLGFVPGIFDGLVSDAATAASGGEHHAHLALWHGFSVELLLSAVVIGGGLLMVLGRARVDALLPRRILPFTGVDAVESLRLALIRGGRRVGDLTRTDVHALHLTLPGIFLLGVLIAGLIASPAVGSPSAGSTRPADWILLTLLAAFLLGTVLSKDRAAAVVLAGGAGFVVASFYFMLGAVDVGITQLLVEILTVVVLVLVLRKLPKRFHRVPRSRTAVSAIVAIAFGAAAFLATYALTGRRGQSDIAQYYQENTYEQTGADNIVNSILVDFRALDTFGELTVLGVAGFAILAVLNSTFATSDNEPHTSRAWVGTPLDDAVDNTTSMRTIFNWVAPLIVLFSLILLVRGHYEPGGGFIAALVAGGFFALRYLVAPSDSAVKLRWDYALVIIGGILVGAATGLLGLVEGSFLKPLTADIPLPGGGHYHFTTAIVFDVGIYLAVIGAVLVALDRLGQVQRYPSELLQTYLSTHPEAAARRRSGAAPLDPGDVPPEVAEESAPLHTTSSGRRGGQEEVR